MICAEMQQAWFAIGPWLALQETQDRKKHKSIQCFRLVAFKVSSADMAALDLDRGKSDSDICN